MRDYVIALILISSSTGLFQVMRMTMQEVSFYSETKKSKRAQKH